MGNFIITAEAGGPSESGSQTLAPGVTATLTSITGRLWSHFTVPVFNGVITLPTSSSDYSAFSGVNIELKLPSGVVYQLGGFYKPTSGSTINYSLPAGEVPLTSAAVPGCELRFLPFNNNGASSPPFVISSVTLPALGVATVSGSESTGNRWSTEDTRQVHSVVPVAITASVYPLVVTIWTNHPSGSVNGQRRWHGWFTLTGPDTVNIGAKGTNTELYTPLADEAWSATVEAGAIDKDTAPSVAAVTSSTFSAVRIQNPLNNLITTLTVPTGSGGNFPYNKISPDGVQYFSIPSMVVDTTAAAASNDVFTVILTAQDLDASGNPIGTEHIYGTPLPLKGVLDFGILDGPYGSVADPPRSGNIGRVRLRVYLCNRINQTTAAWSDTTSRTLQNIDGVGFKDVVVSVAGATPAGVIPATRLDPTTLGQGLARDLATGRPIVNTDNRANIIDNAGFEQGTSGWSGSNFSIIDGGAYTGLKRCKLDDTINQVALVSEAYTHSCRPGDQIYVEAYLSSDNGVGSGGFSSTHVGILWYTSADVFISESAGNGVQDTSGAWAKDTVLGTAPANSSKFLIWFYSSTVTPVAGKYWYVDNVLACRQVPAGSGTIPDGRGGLRLNTTNLANMVLNPGFETGDFSGWEIYQGGGFVESGYSGPPATVAGACRAILVPGASVATLREAVGHACKPGDEFYLEINVQLAFTGVINLYAEVMNADGVTRVAADLIQSLPGGVGSFQKLSGNYVIPSGINAAYVRIYLDVASSASGAFGIVDSAWLAPQVPFGGGQTRDGRGGIMWRPGPGLKIGGTGTAEVKIAGPVYTDVADAVNIRISSDYVVSGGILTQNIIDLGKATNFGTEFTKIGNLFVVNAVAVNKLLAGDALFAGQATFSYNGGGKVTINSIGITLANHNTSPTSTVTISSGGITVARGSNNVQIDSNGVAINGPNGSVTANAAGVTITNGKLTSPTITIINGATTVNFDATNLLMITNSASARRALGSWSSFRIENSADSGQYSQIYGFGFSAQRFTGAIYQTVNLAPNFFKMDGLLSFYPGAGSKEFWYDPADGNRVKFAA
jgi:hypothetical protein